MDKEENPYSLLVGSRSVQDITLESESYQKVLRLYLLRLRKLFQNDENVKGAVVLEDKEERRKQIREFISSEINLGTEDVCEKALSILLDEYDKMKLSTHQQYLVDERTGMVIAPLTNDSLFKPPDYIGEDGKKHEAQAILHPGLSSALGLALQERSKIAAAIEKGGPTFEHLKNPSSIIIVAKEFLESQGFQICECPDGDVQVFEIGHEREEGVFQALNEGFHRFRMFGMILATKISTEMKTNNYSKCEIGTPELIKTNKLRWYKISVKMKKFKELSDNLCS